MKVNQDDLEPLLRVYSEWEAAIIVNALEKAGIRAIATGGFTSGFKAEVPGVVTIQVMRPDLDEARRILHRLKDEQHDQ